MSTVLIHSSLAGYLADRLRTKWANIKENYDVHQLFISHRYLTVTLKHHPQR
jgi:hypothetical protein